MVASDLHLLALVLFGASSLDAEADEAGESGRWRSGNQG